MEEYLTITELSSCFKMILIPEQHTGVCQVRPAHPDRNLNGLGCEQVQEEIIVGTIKRKDETDDNN